MYNKNELAILYLDKLELSYKKFGELLSSLESASEIFEKKGQDKLSLFAKPSAVEFLTRHSYEQIEEYVTKDLEKFNIFAVTICSSAYPEILKNISDPPYVLYTIGDISLLSRQKIGVVGTRKITTYGRDVANKFTRELSQAGLVTVSGLSYGVDTCCAKSTLEAGGKTIAVLAGGLDNIYPADNLALSQKIAKTGLLVSEYRPFVRPKQYSFLARNRIISGLSDGVLVVEAGRHSGATSTANFAIEQGRELFVVPGNINSPQSEGTNDLINEMPDCFTISTSQILTRLGVQTQTDQKTKTVQLDFFSQQIVDYLKNGEAHFDSICAALAVNASELSSALTMLEIMGVVNKNAGNYYSLAM
ncbi:MAG: DNA-processing protein DprA [Clostridia bacterium]|nr:DNA-processing protein DprA [Clostridia bacterium]